MNVDQFKKLNEAYGLTEEQAGQLIDGYRTLQKENERLENELHQMGDSRNTFEGELDKAISEIKFQVERNDKQREVYFKLESELAAKDKVLKWYADEESYRVRGSQGFREDIYVFKDNGQLARSILSRYAKEGQK